MLQLRLSGVALAGLEIVAVSRADLVIDDCGVIPRLAHAAWSALQWNSRSSVHNGKTIGTGSSTHS